MKNEYDLLIVGGGPAGLACAASASRFSLRAAVLEKNPRCGRKLLLTGSGQCNITRGDPVETFFSHYGGKERFVQPALRAFPPSRLISTLTDGGVPLEERSDGKIFPASRRAADILDFFLRAAQKTAIFSDSPVLAVERKDGLFRVETGRGIFSSRALILAAGGSSFPQTGASGDGFRLAESLGHAIVPPRPALAAVTAEAWRFAACAGISIPGAVVTLFREGKKIGRFSGDLLWTHQGLSGPVILDASRNIRPGDRIAVSLLPYADSSAFDPVFREELARSPNRFVGTLLAEFGVPERLVREIFVSASLEYNRTASALTRAERKKIAELFCAFPVAVRAPDGFDKAMATAGGVALNEVNRLTMASRLVEGLFFAGETLDVDGDTGGYNLQFAWSSGSLAGESAAERLAGR